MSKLTVKLPGHPPVTHDLGSGSVVIGRAADCDLQILHGLVSKRHAIIEHQGTELHIRDLGSHNGTFVNSQRVRDAVLHEGDAVRFAVVDCVFELGDQVAPPAPSPSVSKPSSPTNSISTKDLPVAAPEDLEPVEPLPIAAKQAEPTAATVPAAQSIPPSPGPIEPAPVTFSAGPAAGPAPAEPAPKPKPAPPTGKRAPLPKPTAQTLAALKSEPAPPAKPGPAPSPAFQPRPVPRRREAMPTWLFLTLGIGVAGCAAAGVWFWLNSTTTDGSQPLAAFTETGVPMDSTPPATKLTETPPANGVTSDVVEAGSVAAKADPGPVAPPEKMAAKPTISAVDAPAIGAMLRDPSVNIRRSAARALHALGLDAAGALRDLENALKDDDTETRIWAALALTQLDSSDQASVPVLIQGLKHESPEVREASALTVSMIQFQGDESAPVIEMLIRLSVEDPDEAVRRAASSASKLLNAKVSLKRDA